MPVGLKHQHPQQDAEDEDDQEDDESNEEQNLGNSPGARGDSSETEQPGNERDDEKDNGPLDQGASFTDRICLSAAAAWVVTPFQEGRKPGQKRRPSATTASKMQSRTRLPAFVENVPV